MSAFCYVAKRPNYALIEGFQQVFVIDFLLPVHLMVFISSLVLLVSAVSFYKVVLYLSFLVCFLSFLPPKMSLLLHHTTLRRTLLMLHGYAVLAPALSGFVGAVTQDL